MFDIHAVLQSLAKERPLFHSEADFQHSLAWEIHKQSPDAKLRLEYPLRALLPSANVRGDKRHIDILVLRGNQVVAIELKYILREWVGSVEIDGETYVPKSGAGGRLGFITDLSRLEELVASPCYKDQHVTGYAILLTSYTPYWKSPEKQRSVPADVDLHEGLSLHGSYKGDVTLQGLYIVQWRDYNHKPLSDHRFGFFRYLLGKVERQ